MPLTKVKTEGRFLDLRFSADVEPVLERNKMLRAMEQTNTESFFHYATIPAIVEQQWLNEEWMRGNNILPNSEEYHRLVDKKLKDPDWAHLLVVGPRHRVGYDGN